MDLDTLKPELKKIAEKYGIDMLVLFGSQVTGKTHPKSDVDIGYTSADNIEFSTKCKIMDEISDFLKREDIELVNLNSISPVMKNIIADEGVLLYERIVGMFILCKMDAFKIYVETKTLRDLRYQSLRNFIYGTSR